jgi:hypothetical protein
LQQIDSNPFVSQILNTAQLKLLAQDAAETSYHHGQTIFNSCSTQNEPDTWQVIVSGKCEVFEDEVSKFAAAHDHSSSIML